MRVMTVKKLSGSPYPHSPPGASGRVPSKPLHCHAWPPCTQGLTTAHFLAQCRHFCGLHTSTCQSVVSTFCGLRSVFGSQKTAELEVGSARQLWLQ